MNACSVCYVIVIFLSISESKPVQNNFHSDVIVTHWPTPEKSGANENENENQPGFVVRQKCSLVLY